MFWRICHASVALNVANFLQSREKDERHFFTRQGRPEAECRRLDGTAQWRGEDSFHVLVVRKSRTESAALFLALRG